MGLKMERKGFCSIWVWIKH